MANTYISMDNIKDGSISASKFEPIFSISASTPPTHKFGHSLRIELVVDFTKVVVRTHCNECHTFLDEKVIYEVPQSIIDEKCLPVCIDSVKT